MIVRSDPNRPAAILIGPPGAGKSTIGRKLARELGVTLYDTDAGIEEDTGRSIPEIFAADGEPEFRRIEERVVRRAIMSEDGVVSLGGGAILSEATRELLRGRTVVYLEISVAEGLRRTGASTNRPLLNGDDPSAKYRELMRIRRPLYREVAAIRVRTDGRSPGRVVRAILVKLGIEPTETAAAQPVPTQADSTGARRSRSRGRRRRSRTGPSQSAPPGDDPGTETAADAAESGPAQPDSEATGAAQPRKRARRSRRGGRRHARNRTTAAQDNAGSMATAPGTTASPPTARAANHPAPASNSRAGRVRRTASRPAGPPAPNTGAATHPERTEPGSATEGAAAPDPPGPGAERSDHESAPGAGRSRRARARRARLRRALEESEQHT
ncbi:shikimate kinase [Nocardia nova SH22a]|uniref:Shikimate kinase n=1 Tax=Nocardia nova SH22a TaxID=1415166 RepID=W5TJ11_9NOCA|nr:shikimate kinase [Nocardia nova SH22a]